MFTFIYLNILAPLSYKTDPFKAEYLLCWWWCTVIEVVSHFGCFCNLLTRKAVRCIYTPKQENNWPGANSAA